LFLGVARSSTKLVLVCWAILAQTFAMNPGPIRVEPVVLEGEHVRLEPLALSHLDGLCEIGIVEELWRWIPTQVETREQMRAYIELALTERANGVSMPFAQIERASGRVIGSTRYMNIEKNHRRLEIGSTWIAPKWQRSAINTEAKYLLLRHAFEDLGCMRVELKTDSMNEKSRNAILRIGAKQEGIFRNHMLTSSGRVRHTVYFSVIDSEWAGVKAELERRLGR
jgi:RimJ/RimL family protein N-acetyltransferase